MKVSEEIQQKFNDLAMAQRGDPENAMIRIQNAQISQLYGYVAEHTGDLIHRMSQTVNFFKGGYEWVSEKVEKVLRRLKSTYPFWQEVWNQIHSNIEYYRQNPREEGYWTDYGSALAALKALGQAYADEHKLLTPYNQVQKAAQDAAVAIGEFRFEDAIAALEWLDSILKRGEKTWQRWSMKH